MEHLSPAQLGTLRGLLEREAAELQARIASVSEDITDQSDTGPRDVEDYAAQEATRFQARNLLNRERARYEEVLAALDRMEKGTYGICEETDEAIPYRRLEIDPTVRYTAQAQEELEREQAAQSPDPHEDDPVAY